MKSKKRFAFTLIELLIVVAIIAILAAIAVPNFLEAQMRAKVGRVKSDMRTAAMALESYRIDQNRYPHIVGFYRMWKYNTGGARNPGQCDRGGIDQCYNLSTPVAYLSNVALADPFTNAKSYNQWGVLPYMPADTSFSLHYVNVELYRKTNKKSAPTGRPLYYLLSLGPDYQKAGGSLGQYADDNPGPDPSFHFAHLQYDPSNGSVSGGDIIRYP